MSHHCCSTLGLGWMATGCPLLGLHPSTGKQRDLAPRLWLGGWTKILPWVCQHLPAHPQPRAVTAHTHAVSAVVRVFIGLGVQPKKKAVPQKGPSQQRAPLPPYMRNLERSSLISASSHGPWMLSLSC